MKRIAAGLESLSTRPAPPKKWRFLIYFLGFFSIFAAAECALFWAYYKDEITQSETRHIAIAEEHLTELVGAIQRKYASYSDDVRHGAILFELRWGQNSENEGSLDVHSLSRYGNEVKQIFPQYESIRIVSTDGTELFHAVKNESWPFDDSYLFYLKAAAPVLGPRQVYVSPFDMSRSAGLKLQFVTPLYKDAKLLGYLLFGVGSPAFLPRLEEIHAQSPAVDLMLFNSQGQLLCAAACSAPLHVSETLSSFAESDSGVVKTKAGTLVYKTVYPLRGLENVVWTGDSDKSIGSTPGGKRNDYRFMAAAFIPDHLVSGSISLAHLWLEARANLLFLGFAAGGLATVLSRLSEEHDRKRHILQLAIDLYNNAPCGYHSLDSHGTVLLMNDTELGWLGYSRDEVIGKKKYPEFLSSPQSAKEFMERYQAMVHGAPVPPETELRFQARRKDGSLFDLAVTPNCVRDADGRFIMSRTIVTNITERVRLEAALEQEAHLDALTAVYNRGYFMKLAERHLARAQRKNEPLSVLYLDLDHFKKINDTYGHTTGDQVLRHSCRLISESLRPGDLFGRMGGEEFAVLLPGKAALESVAVAERLRRLVSKAPLPLGDDGEIRVTISIGVAEFSTHWPSLDALLSAADEALYRAKNRGRDRVESAAGFAMNAPIPA
jgi:diguanylate cyclase (GGDEF)-like protein/PAS domain S-box-containing protein